MPRPVVRRKLLAGGATAPQRRIRLGAMALAGLALLVVVLTFAMKRRPAIDARFEDGTVVRVAPGTALTAHRTDGAMLRFSDGSTVRLARDTNVRVTEMNAIGARVRNQRGSGRGLRRSSTVEQLDLRSGAVRRFRDGNAFRHDLGAFT